MANKDSTAGTITVALVLCIVCSVIVSAAAVMLKPAQVANKELDFKRNILAAAGLLDPSKSVEEQFSQINTRIVQLETGKFTDGDPDSYDPVAAAKDPSQSRELSTEEDVAKISRLENRSEVYIVEKNGSVDKVILPIRGYGLWSTLYGFLALESDMNTVAGIGFYEHGETPGLGGEVDNPAWKAGWIGKEMFDNTGDVAVRVIKGKAADSATHQIDGLSGATLTSRGVSNLVRFWLSDEGFGKFLTNLKEGEA